MNGLHNPVLLTWKQAQTQQVFSRAIRQAASGVSPTDAFALEVSRD